MCSGTGALHNVPGTLCTWHQSASFHLGSDRLQSSDLLSYLLISKCKDTTFYWNSIQKTKNVKPRWRKKNEKPPAQLYVDGFIVSLPIPYLYIKGNARMLSPTPLHHNSPHGRTWLFPWQSHTGPLLFYRLIDNKENFLEKCYSMRKVACPRF